MDKPMQSHEGLIQAQELLHGLYNLMSDKAPEHRKEG